MEFLKYYPFILFIGWVPLLYVFLKGYNKKSDIEKDNFYSYNNDTMLCILALFLISILFYSYRFIINYQPQGYDTARYIYSVQKLASGDSLSEILGKLEMTHFSECPLECLIPKIICEYQ